MLKVGILGMGGMGWFHTARYLQLPDARLSAIADIVPERLEAREAVQINISDGGIDLDFSNVARYGEAMDLIEDADVDVIDICLPTHLHAPYAIAALEAGYHVICEKPMALSVEAADEMVEAAKLADRRLMIAHVIRFWPEYAFLRGLIDEGRYGALRSLNMWRIGGRPGWAPDNWFLDPARSGGAILDLHIHDVDYINAVLGAPDHIQATGRASKVAKTYDVIHACFGYDGGPQVHMHAGWSAAQIPFTAGFEAWFDEAFLSYKGGELRLFDDLEEVASEAVDIASRDGYLEEIAYFLKCVETGNSPDRCPPESTRDSLRLIQAEIDVIKKTSPVLTTGGITHEET
ncbi:MAG: Gfo/Idh/MocA family protein [Anaerolineae bacterium]